MMTRRATTWLVIAVVAAAAGCGGSGPFALTGGDNDPAALGRVLGNMRKGEGSTGPSTVAAIRNRLGVAVVAVASASELTLVDLAKGTAIWTVPARIASRLVIGRDVVVALEKEGLVARDVESGKTLWTKKLSGELVGHAADGGAVFVTTTSGNRWTVTAYSARSGSSRWSAGASSVLGAPAASRGIVLVPFLNQWLAVLDARSGKSLTRVRSVEEEIEFVRSSGTNVFFGSSKGVFLFDDKAASGSRAQSTYGSMALPPSFAALRYHRDGYDPKQSAYNARDRRQLLWDGSQGRGMLEFAGSSVAVHYYRFIFGLDATDQRLRWVYPHPRYDLIAAGHLGGAIAAISSDGTLVAIDGETGNRLMVKSTGVSGPLIGGTFDAHGWKPDSAAPVSNNASAALTMIVRDRDSRFASIKTFAIRSLAQMQSTEATSALIEVAIGSNPQFAEEATDALVARADPAGAEALVTHLLASGEGKRCVSVCARALAAIETSALKPEMLRRADAVLISLLESPATTDLELAAVALALGRLGSEGGIAALRMFFLVHRADPDVASNQVAVRAIAEALAAAGGDARAAVSFAASDAVTDRAIALEAQRALQLGGADAADEEPDDAATEAGAAGTR